MIPKEVTFSNATIPTEVVSETWLLLKEGIDADGIPIRLLKRHDHGKERDVYCVFSPSRMGENHWYRRGKYSTVASSWYRWWKRFAMVGMIP